MDLDNYLACEQYYPVVIQNSCTVYAIKYLQEKFYEARRLGNATLLQAFADETTMRQSICGWVRTHLAEKVVDTDLVERIMIDIKWSSVLYQVEVFVNDGPLSDTDSDNNVEPSLPPVRVPRRQTTSQQN